MIRFGLIRHAATAWNRQKRIQGQTDISLSTEGCRAVKSWARRLSGHSWDRILASDLSRAAETARILNHALTLPLSLDQRLREQDWGRWAGRTVAEIRGQEPDLLERQEAAGFDFRPPGGESRREVLARSRRALLAAAVRWPESTILVVTHAGPIKCLCYDLDGRAFLPSEPPLIEPAHLHWIRCQQGALRLEAVNALSLV